jgi:hypothetical protein
VLAAVLRSRSDAGGRGRLVLWRADQGRVTQRAKGIVEYGKEIADLDGAEISHLPVLPVGHDSRALRHTWCGAGRAANRVGTPIMSAYVSSARLSYQGDSICRQGASTVGPNGGSRPTATYFLYAKNCC